MKKDDYWFKRRRYGWGWTPVTWQGWAIVVVCLGGIIATAFMLPTDESRNSWTANDWKFLGVVAVLLAVLFIATYAHGPKPKWRWGSSPGDDPREDF